LNSANISERGVSEKTRGSGRLRVGRTSDSTICELLSFNKEKKKVLKRNKQQINQKMRRGERKKKQRGRKIRISERLVKGMDSDGRGSIVNRTTLGALPMLLLYP